jgi:hypothetical protein
MDGGVGHHPRKRGGLNMATKRVDAHYIRRVAEIQKEGGKKPYVISVIEFRNGRPVCGCSCPSWIFHHPRRDCKHIHGLVKNELPNNYKVKVLDKDLMGSLQMMDALEIPVENISTGKD